MKAIDYDETLKGLQTMKEEYYRGYVNNSNTVISSNHAREEFKLMYESLGAYNAINQIIRVLRSQCEK